MINWGFTSWDNFGLAMIALLQATTLEGWSELM